MSRLLLFFQLSWLLFRLSFNVLTFSWQVLLTKFNRSYLSIFFICLGIGANLLIGIALWQHKWTPVTKIIGTESPNSLSQPELSETRVFLLQVDELKEITEKHQSLENQGVTSQIIYTNLSQLTQFSDQDQANNYLQKAKKITPWIAQ
jgi:hypothetical protein